ncbi:hypothetical protein ACK3F5_08460 [Photorhabdus asymbiotica UENP]
MNQMKALSLHGFPICATVMTGAGAADVYMICLHGDTPLMPFAYRWCFGELKEVVYFVSAAIDFDDVPQRKKHLQGHCYRDRPLYMEYDEMGLK